MNRFLVENFLDTYFCQNDIKSQTYFRAWVFEMRKFNSHTQNNYTILQEIAGTVHLTQKEKSPIKSRRSSVLHWNNKRVSKVGTTYISHRVHCVDLH